MRHLHQLMLVPERDVGPHDEPIGVMASGTRLVVVKVERCSFPPGVASAFTLARVEGGQFAGKLVATKRLRLNYLGFSAEFAVPCGPSGEPGCDLAPNPDETRTLRRPRIRPAS